MERSRASRKRGHRIDDDDDLVDPRDREAGNARVLSDQVLAWAEINTKRVVRGDLRLYPLHLALECRGRRIGCRGKLLVLRLVQAAHSGNMTFDHKALHRFWSVRVVLLSGFRQVADRAGEIGAVDQLKAAVAASPARRGEGRIERVGGEGVRGVA